MNNETNTNRSLESASIRVQAEAEWRGIIEKGNTYDIPANAGPLLYEKKRYKSFLGKQVAFAALCAFAPIIGIIIYLFVIVGRMRRYGGKMPDEDSVYFGQYCVDNYKVDRKRHKAHTAIFSILFVFSVTAFISAIIFALKTDIDWNAKGDASILPAIFILFILILYFGIFASILQLSAPRLFRYTIREYACPQCHYANTIHYSGSTNYKSETKLDYVGSYSDSVKSIVTLSDGSKAEIVTKLPSEDIYKKREHASWKDKYCCSRCGYGYDRHKSIIADV